MKKYNLKQAFSKPKTVYTMAGISFCLAAVAIGIVYSQTMDTLEKALPPVNTTQQVNVAQSGEDDPRRVTRVTTSKAEETTLAEEITLPPATTAAVTEDVVATTASPEVTEAKATEASSFILPHDGEIIRNYSPDIPLYCETMNDWRTHNGIDIAVGEGEEVLSVGKGTVSKVLANAVYGYTIEVDYGTFTARYCGMKQGECVGIGQMLEKGDSVGMVDVVPCEANSPKHLHFEVMVEGMYEDPMKILE